MQETVAHGIRRVPLAGCASGRTSEFAESDRVQSARGAHVGYSGGCAVRRLSIALFSVLVGVANVVGIVAQPATAVASSAALSTVGANGDVLAITSDAEHVYIGGK